MTTEVQSGIKLGDLCLIGRVRHWQETVGDPVIVIEIDDHDPRAGDRYWIKVLKPNGRSCWKRKDSLRLGQNGGQYVEAW